MTNMIYDIRTSEYARRTLVNLTGVPISVWEKYLLREREYEYIDNLVADVISTYGHLPESYIDFNFIYFHVTTSSNGCESFWKHGILDLKQSYLCQDSELRKFLEEYDIYIDLDDRTLEYLGKRFDISYSSYAPRHNTEAYKCWSVGRKFYFDYTTCGFLSVWDRSPYGGQVHHRPEILTDIDNLLGLRLSQEWTLTHRPYEIVAKVSGERIVYDGDDYKSDEDKVLDYLVKAYCTAFNEPTEEVILLNNNEQISPSDILEIKPLEHWKGY